MGHVRLPGRVVGGGAGVTAYKIEVGGESFGQALGGLDLEEVIPQRVGVVDGEGAAEPLGHLGVARLGVGVAVAHLGQRRMPGGQVDEAQFGPGGAPGGERRPLRE